MSFIGRFLRERAEFALVQAFFIAVFACAFALVHLPLAAVLYPAGVCALSGALFLIRPLQRAWEKHRALAAVSGLSGEVIGEQLPAYPALCDEDYRRIIAHLCGELAALRADTARSRKETMDYYTTWVHQIKTPIASMRLHLKAEDTPLARKLMSDLLHIEQYADMALTYLRMGSETTDYVFREVALDGVIRKNIRKFRGDFIVKKLTLRYEPVRASVISDEKWLSFVIGQILSNALKYTGEGGAVTIAMETPDTLCISDTGIGIAPEDLPRIFERGYTGYNGRTETRSSGIGLSLCRQICGRLGHSISASSTPGEGTEIRIGFQ